MTQTCLISTKLGHGSFFLCVAARNAAAAPLSGASDGVVRGDLRWSGREGGRRVALYLRVVELIKYPKGPRDLDRVFP